MTFGTRPLAAAPRKADPVAHALAWSRFARRLAESRDGLREELEQGIVRPFDRDAMRAFLEQAAVGDEDGLKAALRRLRSRVVLRVLTRDLAGLADLAEVTATMTALAETAIAFSAERLQEWMRRQYGEPVGEEGGEPQGLLVVGMGKLGGGELNVSSDVDLIFLYPEEGETRGPQVLSNHEFFGRLGRRLISALHDLTADGYVFRVDMRLRPDGESGPLAVSFATLENYFYTQGREWERYAWIKGRVVAGPCARELAQLVTPFVFRKYLDYGAFESMRALHGQIRQEVKRREMQDNIKLGPGGIREIEFIAQVFQLIRGGRDPELRVRPTLEALARVAEKRLLPEDAVRELAAAYVFLRDLEHRLQYLDDRQTQTLPADEDDRRRVAEATGFAAWPALLERLEAHRAVVTRHFEQVFASGRGAAPDDGLGALWRGDAEPDAAAAALASLGYHSPPAIVERLERIRASARYRQLPGPSRERFDALAPALLRAAAAFPNADAALERMLNLLETISRRAAYLALLQEYPQALERVAKLSSASSWASEFLTRHPILLDELLDDQEILAPPNWPRFEALLDAQLKDAEGDPERQMEVLRNVQHMKVFRLLIRDLEGLLTVEHLSDHLSYLADLMLARVLGLAWAGLRQKHRDGPPQFAVIGYGKLGGKELGYASDLDIIFLHDDSHPDAQEVYARLAMRMNSWLTSYTPAGVLYETDLRLRPDGASGMLVSPLAAFEEYQGRQAWVWEHQALTRARFVAGDRRVGAEFERIRIAVLRKERDLTALAREVVEMRARMHDAHPNPSGLFDLKHDSGGIIDVEFIVQYLVLGHASVHPGLTANIGNLALLKLSGELGLIPPSLAERVRVAYRGYRRIQHQLRLNGAREARVTPEIQAGERAAVLELWQRVFGGETG
ncbi:MAG TPA: bifunctional [glutamate--ammonia ligase]-adenylyl-L-tyrosine phosphorylase/[glutamate--ammonia-ligase] adenylyltransferase [Burkholderiales bacterium]|nr:bifunctional [glutamate--ammonia ligase]-adenylyl-L-tyrosine phosphorylase/[glutamate--ammonia-ligase] adenylyltransferase [Burkholderiales bacterium]